MVLVAAVVGGAWLYVNKNVGQGKRVPDGAKAVDERPKIDHQSFSREEAISSLTALESASPLDFNTALHRKIIEPSTLPKEAMPFITPAPGETVKAEQDSKGAPAYYVSYFSENPMPENYLSQSRIARQNGFNVLRGVRDQLSSTLDLESPTHQVRISQLAVSEEKTEVIIYIKNR